MVGNYIIDLVGQFIGGLLVNYNWVELRIVVLNVEQIGFKFSLVGVDVVIVWDFSGWQNVGVFLIDQE